MERIELIFAQMSSEDENIVVLNEVHGILSCESIEQAKLLGNMLKGVFGDFIIPSEYNGTIVTDHHYTAEERFIHF